MSLSIKLDGHVNQCIKTKITDCIYAILILCSKLKTWYNIIFSISSEVLRDITLFEINILSNLIKCWQTSGKLQIISPWT